MNPKVDCRPRIKNANLCLLRRSLAFVRLALAKISDEFGGLPKRIVEGSIEFWRMVNRYCLRHSGVIFRSSRQRGGSRTGACVRRKK